MYHYPIKFGIYLIFSIFIPCFQKVISCVQKIAFCYARDNLLQANRPPFGKPRFYRPLSFDSLNVYLGRFRVLLPYSDKQ